MELVYETRFHEDGSCTVKARVSADDGTGAATGKDGEGNFLKVADFSTITVLIYDITASSPQASPPTFAPSAVILDTPVTSAAKWGRDPYGYNFVHTLPITAFPTGGSEYQVEYLFTTTGGAVGWLKVRGIADETHTS